MDMSRPLVPEDRRSFASGEVQARVGEFFKLAQVTALHGAGAFRSDEAQQATARVQRVLKAAIAPIDSAAAGAAVSEMRQLSEAFATSLVGVSVFDTLLARGMRRVPLKSRGVVISTAPVGSPVPEAGAKPISELALAGATLDPQKVWAAVACTKELLDFSQPGALELFREELRRAVVRSTDAAFLAQLYAATTPTASAGSSFANTMTDLTALLGAVDTSPTSRVYWVVTPAKVKALVTMLATTGGFAFPNLAVSGGPLLGGIEVLASDQLPANSSILIVADGLVGNSERIGVPANPGWRYPSEYQSGFAQHGGDRLAVDVAARPRPRWRSSGTSPLRSCTRARSRALAIEVRDGRPNARERGGAAPHERGKLEHRRPDQLDRRRGRRRAQADRGAAAIHRTQAWPRRHERAYTGQRPAE